MKDLLTNIWVSLVVVSLVFGLGWGTVFADPSSGYKFGGIVGLISLVVFLVLVGVLILYREKSDELVGVAIYLLVLVFLLFLARGALALEESILNFLGRSFPEVISVGFVVMTAVNLIVAAILFWVSYYSNNRYINILDGFVLGVAIIGWILIIGNVSQSTVVAHTARIDSAILAITVFALWIYFAKQETRDIGRKLGVRF